MTLAGAAIAIAAPFLAEFVKKVGGDAAQAAGRKLVDWLSVKMPEPEEQKVMEELADAPDDGDNRELLALHLRKRLRADPALAEELAALIEEAKSAGLTEQSATVTGNDNIVTQVSGDNINISLNKK